MILATYLPFYRVHEVNEYFMKNVEKTKPDQSFVYVDNVFNPKQVDILRSIIPHDIQVRTGNWRNRSSTWFTMLKDFHVADEAVIVDSDNILDDSFMEADSKMDYDMYTVYDKETWSRGGPNAMSRSRKASEIVVNGNKVTIYAYKIYDSNLMKGGHVLFIGPKQAVIYKKMPDIRIVERVEAAFQRVPPEFRQFISDETVLGIIAYLSGIRETPWIVMSSHMHHGSGLPLSKQAKAIVASAHMNFGKSLRREFKLRPFTVYELKYTISLIRNAHNLW